jgi:hypothetical protein
MAFTTGGGATMNTSIGGGHTVLRKDGMIG